MNIKTLQIAWPAEARGRNGYFTLSEIQLYDSHLTHPQDPKQADGPFVQTPSIVIDIYSKRHSKSPPAMLNLTVGEAERLARAILATVDEIRGVIRCRFVSAWDDESRFESPAVYDPRTGHVETDGAGLASEDATLRREFILLEDGTEMEVCGECHEYILREGKCPNPDCENKA